MAASPSVTGAPAGPSTPTKQGKSAASNVTSMLGNTAGKAKGMVSSNTPQKGPQNLGGSFDQQNTPVQELENTGEGVVQNVGQAADNVTQIDLSALNGLKVAEGGAIKDPSGTVLAKIVEGDPEDLVGYTVNDLGEVLDDDNDVIGRAEVLPQEQQAGGTGDEQVDGDDDEDASTEDLTSGAVNDVSDPAGEAAEEGDEAAPELPPLSTLEGLKCNKLGKITDQEGRLVGELIEGNAKSICQIGAQSNENGIFHDSQGRQIGRAKTVPREDDKEGPFAGLGELVVVEDGLVKDQNNDNIVGKIVDGDPKELRGRAVDEDGDILDRHGNSIGFAERYEIPEEEVAEEDLSPLLGKIITKAGFIVDESNIAIGRVASGDGKKLAGRRVGPQGKIYGDTGEVIGQAELIPEAEREKPEGPFSGLEGLVVGKDGLIRDRSDEVVGRLVQGDAKLLKGRYVDSDGEVTDRSGNVLGKAERWEPEETPPDVNPMSGRKVNRDGEVRNEDGELIGKLTQGDLKTLIGKSIDDDGFVISSKGEKMGECTLLENLPDEEPQVSQEQLDAEKKNADEKELAKKMSAIVQQTLDKIGPVCKMITEHIEKADRTPKEELDEEQLVQNVKPLIEEGGNALQECNGALRALDPDGRISAQAKSRSAQREASTEEYQLAEQLKEMTSTVTTTIDNAKKRIADMPHAKKELNPLWGLLSEPLFQIIAAVGLLLTGVLGLVGKLLNGLGLGGLVDNLLGGLGLNRLFDSLGLSSITNSLNLGG